MVCLEIFRVQQRAQDYRNAYNVLIRLNEKCPNNPMIISRLGRFCLEIGKKVEAISLFSVIEDMLERQNRSAQSASEAASPTAHLDNLLGSNETKSADNNELAIVNLLNQGFLKIFEAQYEEAIKYFRQVQTFRPGNIVAANNLATCKIFLNKVGESIKTLEDLVKKDPLNNINEQVVQNIVSMYDIQFAQNPNDKKSLLADFCSKHSKDSVNAAVYVQHAQVKA